MSGKIIASTVIAALTISLLTGCYAPSGQASVSEPSSDSVHASDEPSVPVSDPAQNSGSVSENDPSKDSPAEYQVNEEFDEDHMISLSGEEQDLSDEDLLLFKEAGLGYIEPSVWEDLLMIGSDQSPFGYCVYYGPEEYMRKYVSSDDLSEEEYEEVKDNLSDTMVMLFSVFRMNEDEYELNCYDSDYIYDYFTNDLDVVNELATIGDNTFYFAYNSTVPDADYFTESEKANIQTIYDTIDELINNIVIFPPVNPLDDSPLVMTSFNLPDIYGNEVTEEIFADYDVTMINLWTTWCPYCIREMPEIERLYEDLPDNMNIIAICLDYEEDPETAVEEMEQAGVTFTVIGASEELYDKIDSYVSGYPTTYCVDSKGNPTSIPFDGSPADPYNTYLDLMIDAL